MNFDLEFAPVGIHHADQARQTHKRAVNNLHRLINVENNFRTLNHLTARGLVENDCVHFTLLERLRPISANETDDTRGFAEELPCALVNRLLPVFIDPCRFIIKSELAKAIAWEELLCYRALLTVLLLSNPLSGNNALPDKLLHALELDARFN